MQICPGSRAPPAPVSVQIWAYPGMQRSRSVTDSHERGDTNTFPARGRERQEEEDTDRVCPRECRRVSPWVEVSPTENIVITHNPGPCSGPVRKQWKCPIMEDILFCLFVWCVDNRRYAHVSKTEFSGCVGKN